MIDQASDILRDLDVSRETIERLEVLVALLKKWNPAINLVSRATIKDVWARHILDSAQLFDLAPDTAGQWADLGSGGGFPGLVVAIIAAELRPEMRLTLVESDRRKAEFLRQACRSLDLKAQVVADRIENATPLGADVVSARALAPLDALFGYAYRHLAPRGIGLFSKGASYLGEIEHANSNWRFGFTAIPSKTDSTAAILKVKDLSHV